MSHHRKHCGTPGGGGRLPLVLLAGVLSVSLSHSGVAQGNTVPGPWGALIDHERPLTLETPAARITHLRRQRMRAISAHFRSIEAAVTYAAPASREELAADATALAALGRSLDNVFAEPTPAPAGQPGARAAIWAEPEKFSRHSDGFGTAVAAATRAIDSGSALGDAVSGIRHQCLACHQSYREFPPRR